MAEALKQTWKKKVVVVGLVTAACHTGTARAQLRPGDLAASQGPTYVVEGIALGSNIKADSSTYREYKCGPSDQFNGFTWCQRSRRDTERRGTFDAAYSILHSKDGAVVYANRTQQPAFLEASKADRDIQSYSRKFGQPKITKMPRRSGTSDAIMATWGKIALDPLDNESIRLLAQGKSPKKGLLIDFLGNFTRSAQEGAPIYRIVGNAGFVWVGSFDKKGRGTLRFAAVDASALQPGPVAIQVPNASQNDDQQPQGDDQRPGKDQAQLPSVTTGSDVEATIARLQTELAAAVKAKGEADRARTDAEKVARQSRTDAEIARRQFEAAINDANAAKAGIEKLGNAGGRSASYVTEIILIGAFVVVLFLIRLLSRMAAASSEARDVENADIGSELYEEDVQAAVALPTVSSTKIESSVDHDKIVAHLAEALGVQRPVVPLSPIVLVDTDLSQSPIELQEQSDASGDKGSGPSIATTNDDSEISKSIVPDIPYAAEVKDFESAEESHPGSQP